MSIEHLMIWLLVANKYHPIFGELWLLSKAQEIKIAKPPVTPLAECEQKAHNVCVSFWKSPDYACESCHDKSFWSANQTTKSPFSH